MYKLRPKEQKWESSDRFYHTGFVVLEPLVYLPSVSQSVMITIRCQSLKKTQAQSRERLPLLLRMHVSKPGIQIH